MLSRTADNLYWMARYTERAENIARMLDVTYKMSFLPHHMSAPQGFWGATLGITGLEEPFLAKYADAGGITAQNVVRYMVLDLDNSSSILASLKAARENAHAVRGTLTSETWETLNTTWIEARNTNESQLQGAELSKFFEWVKFRSHLSRGVTVGTMLQDEAFQFIRLGTFLERADNTARILDVRYDELAPTRETAANAHDNTDDNADYYEWGALLRSVSAFEIYRKVYRDMITPKRVAELLILRREMPRSIAACMSEVHSILRQISNNRSAETERRAGAIHSRIQFARIDDILQVGLHHYLTEFLGATADLGARISSDFLVSAN